MAEQKAEFDKAMEEQNKAMKENKKILDEMYKEVSTIEKSTKTVKTAVKKGVSSPELPEQQSTKPHRLNKGKAGSSKTEITARAKNQKTKKKTTGHHK